jgi:hypothetical protein
MELKTPTDTRSPHDMEVEISKTPISLPQIYSYLSENMNQDIAFHIFSLQFHNKISLQRIEESCIVAMLTTVIQMMLQINNYSHCFTVELLKQSLLDANESLCDITTKSDNETVLHMIANDGCLFKNICTEAAKVFLDVAGNETLKLLTMQTLTLYGKYTALHFAAEKGNCELVHLFLESAGDNVLILMNIKNYQDKTAFDIATPEVKTIMLPYMQNNQ